MTAPIGPGDWLQCVDVRPTDRWGDPRLTLGGMYCVAEIRPEAGKCTLCGRCDSVRLVNIETRRGSTGFKLCRFRPAGHDGMFNSLLTAKPVRVGEDA